MKIIASGFAAAVLAFDCATAPSQSPWLAADESSRSTYLIVKLPTFLPSSVRRICSTSVLVCSVLVPWRGRLEYTTISLVLVPFLFSHAAGFAPVPDVPPGAALPPGAWLHAES